MTTTSIDHGLPRRMGRPFRTWNARLRPGAISRVDHEGALLALVIDSSPERPIVLHLSQTELDDIVALAARAREAEAAVS